MTNIKLTTTYALNGLHCGACVNKVTQALTPLAAGVEVSLQPMQVTLTDAKADFEALKAAVENAGKYVLMPHSAQIQLSNMAPHKSIQGQIAAFNAVEENSADSRSDLQQGRDSEDADDL